jgi:anti-anti-sigma factor
MEINKRKENSVMVVEPVGDMGLYNLGHLRTVLQDLREQGELKVLIDMGKIPGTDSTGIGFLIQETALFDEEGGKLKLCGISQGVRKSLMVTETLTQLDVHETVDAALAAFSK